MSNKKVRREAAKTAAGLGAAAAVATVFPPAGAAIALGTFLRGARRFAQLAQHLQLAAERIPLDRVTVALVGDGAPWVWNAMEGSFPEGHQVLDYYHCAEHVWSVADARYGDSLEAQNWAETTLARLSLGLISDVLGGLKRMKPSSDSATEEVSKLINYLEEHRHRVQYDEAREQGLPQGSRGIESANKFLVHARLKRSGAWWLEANGNGMLRLRCAIYNGTFDRLFKKRSPKLPVG